MNWDALGAIGELVGALAVIVTLIYIAAQVRENTKSLKGFSVDSALNASLNVTSDLTGDAELGQLWASGMEAWDGLDERERTRLIFLLFR